MPPSAAATGPALEHYRWLTTLAAAPYLEWTAASAGELAATASRLRRELPPERARLVLEQAALRRRARAKFTLADRMFFTARGLEQATDEIVAAHKAQRFSLGQPNVDLCSGVGGDLLALAARGPTTGVDRDPILATLAEANGYVVVGTGACISSTFSPPRVIAGNVADDDVADCAAWHIDPDRRPSGRRTTRVALHEPGPDTIERLLIRNPNAAIKLAPAAVLPDGWEHRAELEWISHARECRQLVAWFGSLARDVGLRRATVLGPAGSEPRSIVGAGQSHPPIAGRVERYLFEPDPAVLAAGLDGVLAALHGLAAIAPRVAYWTGPQPIRDRLLACFEVIEVLPLRRKPLASLLRTLDVGQLEIKKRAVDLDPETLRRKLKLEGATAATLLVTAINKHVTAIVARRQNP